MWSRRIAQQSLSSLLRTSRRRSSSHNRHQLVVSQRLLHNVEACRRFTSDSSFHGIHLPDEDDDTDNIARNQPTIQEAEVVISDEDKQKIRESIAEVVRAELSAYSAPNNEINNEASQIDSDNSKEGEEENNVLEGYDRLMHMLNIAQTRHDCIILDQQKTNSLEYIHSTMDLGELHYQLGNMEQSQDMYMSALKQLLEKNNANNDNDEEANDGNSIMMMMVAQCMHSLGAIHARCGEYDEAYRWYEEALKRKNDIVNSDGGTSDSARCNNFELGKTYNAMAALQTMRGGMQWKEAMSMFQLAERHQLHGYIRDDNEDGDTLERVTKQTVEQLTPHHVQSIVSIRFNVGKLLQQQSQYGDAVDAFRSGLELARLDIERMRTDDAKELGTESVSNPSPSERKNIVVELLVHIADCLSSIHSYDEAAQTYEEALGYHIFFRQWKGRDRSNESENQQENCLPATISTTNIKLDIANATTMEAAIRSNLALALAHIGQEKLGLEHYEASLKIKRRIGGDDHIEVAHTLIGMGALYGGPMRDFASALNCFKEALYIYRQKLNALTGADSLPGSNKFFGEDESEEIDIYIQNAVKNIALIEAGLLKDREDGINKTRRR